MWSTARALQRAVRHTFETAHKDGLLRRCPYTHTTALVSWSGQVMYIVTLASMTGLKVSHNLGRQMGPMKDYTRASISQRSLSLSQSLLLGAQALCFL